MEIVTVKRDSVPTTCTPDWRAAMRDAIRDPFTLCERLKLPESLAAAAVESAADFALFAPLGFVDKMQVGDPNDPLLRQVLPLAEERLPTPGFQADPLGERQAELRPGLLQKYHGRALLVTTGTCAIHCRYCFRRHFPYHDGPPQSERWEQAIDAIREDESIEEVLLSGGDPLTVSDPSIGALLTQLDAIPHIARIRIHTRLPIVIPERVTPELVESLRAVQAAVVVVIHANHERELDAPVIDACRRLQQTGAVILNQSVLLRGVNDTLADQESLCRRLINSGVTPYYLHQMDRVNGAAHFETPKELGVHLIEQLRKRLPGYAVPRFVQEIAGEQHKRVLA